MSKLRPPQPASSLPDSGDKARSGLQRGPRCPWVFARAPPGSPGALGSEEAAARPWVFGPALLAALKSLSLCTWPYPWQIASALGHIQNGISV